jgi:hypothetical protein
MAANGTEATMAADPHQPLLPAGPVDDLRAQVSAHTAQLDLLGETVTGHADLLARLHEDLKLLQHDDGARGHQPIPAPRWHELEGQARADAIGRLQDWVQRVYRPVYGYLAAGLGACWPEHPLALVVLDHLSETWAVLYARTTRPQHVLARQLEFHLRYVPAAAEMLRAETHGCGHAPPRTAP